MGIKVDDSGRIWYVNRVQNKLYRIDTQTWATSVKAQKRETISASFYPNPGNGLVTAEINNQNQDELKVVINDLNGKQVYQSFERDQFVSKRLDLTHLSSGVYLVSVMDPASGMLHQQKLVIR